MKTQMTYGLVILLAVAHLSVAGTFYVVEEGQQAIILQFGRPVGAPVTEAGFYFKVPFIQEVRRFDKRLLIWDGEPNQIPTAGREFIAGPRAERQPVKRVPDLLLPRQLGLKQVAAGRRQRTHHKRHQNSYCQQGSVAHRLPLRLS